MMQQKEEELNGVRKKIFKLNTEKIKEPNITVKTKAPSGSSSALRKGGFKIISSSSRYVNKMKEKLEKQLHPGIVENSDVIKQKDSCNK